MKCYMKIITFICLLGASATVLAMAPMSESELESVAGQGLIVSETIEGTGPGAGFNFMRMGLDAEVSLNANIDRLQLGCGGFNESIRTGCDIDMDYVRLMGRSPSGVDNPNQVDGNPRAGDPVTSDFVMTRPYIEIAMKGSGTTREVAGIKISSQETTGFFGVGRNDGGTHTGLNSFSGYMNVYLSGYVQFDTSVGSGYACIGEPAGHTECANSPDGELYNNSDFNSDSKTVFKGTRLEEIHMESVPLRNLHGADGILGWLEGNDMYAVMDARLKDVHGFEFNQTQDFFLSFQRESIAYPNYDKSGYAEPTNAGWWMNVPKIELRDLEPAPVDLTDVGLLDLLGSFSEPGVYAGYPNLQSVPPDNCYGGAVFC